MTAIYLRSKQNVSSKQNVITGITGFYHIALMGQWKFVVGDQVAHIINSGLYNKTKTIYVSVLGDQKEQEELVALLPPKFQIIHRSTNVGEFEFPTLIYMHDFCQNNNCNVWYIHTKGVSHSNRRRQWIRTQAWRWSMEAFVIDQHEMCNKLLDKYVACGTRWMPNDGNFPNAKWGKKWPSMQQAFFNTVGWFAGNFWWARSDYVRQLPDLRNCDRTNRFECETWIGKLIGENALAFDGDNLQPQIAKKSSVIQTYPGQLLQQKINIKPNEAQRVKTRKNVVKKCNTTEFYAKNNNNLKAIIEKLFNFS